MRLHLVTLLAVFISSISFAQDRIHQSFSWESPIASDSTDKASSAPFIVLQDERYFDYDLEGDEELMLFQSRHQIALTNTLEGIEYNNKLYIPLDEGAEVVKLMVRTILPNGEIIETKDDATRELKDLEGYKNLKILAINGVVLGSTVEYFYTIKTPNPNFWSSIYLQSGVPIKSSKVILRHTDKMTFTANLENDTTEINKMESADGVTTLGVELKNIPAFRKEIYSEEAATKIRFDYTLKQLTGENASEPFDWYRASNRYSKYYASVYTRNKRSSKQTQKVRLNADKKLARLLKPQLKGITGLKQRITAIEDFIKDQKNFKFDPEASEELATIIETKTYSERGLTKLMCHSLMTQEIQFSLVFTTDRFRTNFPEKDVNWIHLREVLLYIPQLEAYVAPTSPGFRVGMLPANYSANFGLFIPIKDHGNRSNNGEYRIEWIKPSKNEENFSNMNIDLDLSTLNEPIFNLKHSYGGMEALNYKVDLEELSEMERQRYDQFFAQMIAEDAELISAEFKNYSTKLDPLKYPFESYIKAKVPSLMEQAGSNTFLFKIGETIGPQVQMYQEEERITDAVIQFPHEYKRIISCELPEGYSVEGLEGLNMDINHTEDGKVMMGFKSSYTLEGNKLTVEVYEFYSQVRYPKEIFEEFRTVINAAADFNKVTLILSKK